MITIQSETKSILTDGDWKKLWMEAGNTNANLKKDNSIDSSDSPIFDETEVSDRHLFIYTLNHKIDIKYRYKMKMVHTHPNIKW